MISLQPCALPDKASSILTSANANSSSCTACHVARVQTSALDLHGDSKQRTLQRARNINTVSAPDLISVWLSTALRTCYSLHVASCVTDLHEHVGKHLSLERPELSVPISTDPTQSRLATIPSIWSVDKGAYIRSTISLHRNQTGESVNCALWSLNLNGCASRTKRQTHPAKRIPIICSLKF